MRFNDAMQANVVIDVGDEQISIPRFTVGDFVEWGAELDAEKRAAQQAAIAELPPKERFEARLLYKIIPADFTELARLTYTPAGVQRVISKCLGRAKVTARKGVSLSAPETLPAERIPDFIAANLPDIPLLARLLAGVEVPDSAPPPKSDEQKAAGADPLPSGGTNSGDGSPATGSATSPPSTPATPASTPPA